ncbi:hypothetical protein PMAYCL1PPCAC_31794 [Pristionchus mayeri]|uniref:Uncharacterized protein n=1 Tax=Pristionchus mayeri TaxID=1317129 RepID=A0AAN5DH05_9BILA|nr:hypothetical protein PMAYCL1PPCAC_31794 [Pristionchus mayeri]
MMEWFLCKSMGYHVGKVELWLGKKWNEVQIMSSLLNEIKFTTLDLIILFLSKELASQILSITKFHGIDDIYFGNVDGDDPAIETVDMLIEFSEHVRSMTVNQFAPYLFGVIDGEWGPVIIKMFSNKLDYLRINTMGKEPQISKYSADLLRERLPLMGKKISFLSGCKNYYEKGLDYTTHDHWIKASGNSKLGMLTIRHLSRLNEGR